MDNLPKHEDFKDSLVAFIDILGFDQRVKAITSQEDFFEIGKLLYAARATADNLSSAEGILQNFKITAISDSIIVTVPFTDSICTVGLLHILHNMQYELLATEFKTMIRGYINRGPVYYKDGLVFGSGYSDAYGGERLIGGAPRIVLSPSVVKDAKRVINQYGGKKKMVTALDFLMEDKSDGFYFIDFLKPIGSQSVLSRDQVLAERASIRNFIESCISKYELNYKVLAKYKWLKNYFEITSKYFE